MENGQQRWSGLTMSNSGFLESTTEEPSHLDEQLRITSQEDVDADVTRLHV